ncbi:MAG: ribulose-phosphate 3-epimerase [Candidatus Cloacimonetes bacterium]|jgi:ribulose-phosphate 3-epimerase|nr:ribulose-phosphate 3-epimerase [Candidatus Cloacimonadota bacterium]MCB5286718.1 ribulose-phosphate 3-epimerase [Candidatus Cloacimonadota bacterium]MCK9184440.1 ribulose-phosphate 3-epimerase [Candidatus Cloacimonadota bacterium]MCK9584468.1 ribulose-phosphate 3-epimerase [Candidatus Cloacimonadota bacterium]MDY0229039.1 ribulose-phosphate 3-epimerase [Candidatus Cloacimonadaceae bacterium]
MNTLIAASVLSADFSRLGAELSRLKSADLIHLDLMDGHFVPNLSFGYPLVSCIRGLTEQPLDAHLMVTNPETYVDNLAAIGVSWISFHQETVYHSHRLIQQIKAHGIKAGIALNPATPINTLDSILPDLDYVLVMSVNPGYSAQAFIPSAIAKIKELDRIRKNQSLDFLIEVDGGVNGDNSTALREAKADILVSASYIFGSKDYDKSIITLRGEINVR